MTRAIRYCAYFYCCALLCAIGLVVARGACYILFDERLDPTRWPRLETLAGGALACAAVATGMLGMFYLDGVNRRAARDRRDGPDAASRLDDHRDRLEWFVVGSAVLGAAGGAALTWADALTGITVCLTRTISISAGDDFVSDANSVVPWTLAGLLVVAAFFFPFFPSERSHAREGRPPVGG